jgi:hypothetical protein
LVIEVSHQADLKLLGQELIARSSGDTETALTLSSTVAERRPILIKRARATSLPADVEMW